MDPRAWGTSCQETPGPIAWDCKKGGRLGMGRAQRNQRDLKGLFLASQGLWAEVPSPCTPSSFQVIGDEGGR